MAFVHGKAAQCALRDVNGIWRDMTAYLTEVTVPGKAGVAETTVFGRGAKTYIGGLLEGQITMKGFYDPTATTGPDSVLSGLLGSQAGLGPGPLYGTGLTAGNAFSSSSATTVTGLAQVTLQSNYGQFLLFPGGTSSNTNIGVIADVVLTDYSLSAPVTNVVSFTATFNLSGAPYASWVALNSGTAGSANGAAGVLPHTFSSAGTPGASTATSAWTYATNGTFTAPYGLQVIRAAVGDLFQTMAASQGWLFSTCNNATTGLTSASPRGTGVYGATSYANLIGTIL